MLRDHGIGLASDAIAHRYGFDGHENDEVESMCRGYARLGVRSTFAINTCYPEISGGYFENRALYELIDTAMRALGLLPILWQSYSAREGTMNVVAGLGQLLMDEKYALVDKTEELKGLLQIWRFHAGGGGKYYADNVIFDLILPAGIMQLLVDEVERKCVNGKVRFRRENCP